MRYPERIEWASELTEGAVSLYYEATVQGPEDAFDHAEVHARERGFSVVLGNLALEGDAIGYEDAKRCAEAALRALIDLNNTLSAPSSGDPLALLSAREREVVRALQSGKRAREIAKALYISNETVRNHLKNAFRKLGVNSQVELLAHVGGRRG